LASTPNILSSGETDWKDFPNESPIIPAAYAGESTYIPEILFLKTAREMILKDPIAFDL
jgi:hypothetical protein